MPKTPEKKEFSTKMGIKSLFYSLAKLFLFPVGVLCINIIQCFPRKLREHFFLQANVKNVFINTPLKTEDWADTVGGWAFC